MGRVVVGLTVTVAVAACAVAAVVVGRRVKSRRKWKKVANVLKELEEGCDTSVGRLRQVVDAMAVEMHAGLASEGGSKLKMLLTYVDNLPNGTEKGPYYALHLGGTNFRVTRVHLSGQPSPLLEHEVERQPIPPHLMTSTSEDLFDFIASSLKEFIAKEGDGSNTSQDRRELGFTFSFPMKQMSVSSGILIKWTKGFSIVDMVGRDVVACLQEAFVRKGLDVHVAALVNDTVGTLAVGHYHDPDTVAAIVIGTGTNACYLERIDAIIKCQGLLTTSGRMVVNMEWGNFWSSHLPRTPYDIELDAESPNPNDQGFEKMISGMYLGDVVRRVILRMSLESDMLFGPISTKLSIALYVTALGTGGLKSSVSGFGSDQFDDSDKDEKKGMIKFFSWFYFFVSIGSLAAVTVLVYIQDNKGRDWGYGICAVAIVVAVLVYLSGTRKYRIKQLVGSPLTQIAVVFVAAWRKRRMQLPSDSSLLYEEDDVLCETPKNKKQRMPHSKQFRFLDKAAIKVVESGSEITIKEKWYLSTLTDVEEVKLVIRMLPIWATTIMFWTIHAQMTTFSVSQATTMNCHIGKSFEIPAASMTVFLIGTILLTVPFYDRFIRPVAKKLLNNSHGFSPLQRIGVGLVLSVLSMVAAALIEIKRLNFARSHGFIDNPTAKMPLSVFWLVPQFFLVGSGEAFMYMGQLDFFLRECPKGMKTMSTGLFLSTLSLGFFFSSLLVTIVNNVTGPNKPWIADNLNQGRLYDFYWLLAMLSAINVVIYLACAKWYVYKEKRLAEVGIELEEIDDASTFH